MDNDRRLVGIDLGIASAHTVRVLDGTGETVAKRKAWPTVESLSEVEEAALAGCAAGTRLEVVVEPTGPAWLPIAVFFAARGHLVFRVSSAKAADLRRFLSRHTKTNGIDADTLARLPLFDPVGLQPLALPGAERAALDRRVRACDRLTQVAAEHKRRIKDLVRQLLPMTPLTGDLGVADMAVLERFADPNTLVKAGHRRLTALIVKASNNHQGAERAQQWLDAAQAALDLYGAHPAIAFADLAAEVATEVRLLSAAQTELAGHAAERENAYRWVDHGGLARSLPGFAEVGGPALVAGMGEPGRFRRGKQFRSFTGLAPKASETGDTDRKGQAMSKAGSSLLRTTLVRAADHARKQDPQLARIYYVQMVETRQGPPRRPVRGRRQPRRAGLGRPRPGHALCHLRHRRPPGGPRRGQGHHRRALDRAHRGARPPAQHEGGEGPPESPHGTVEAMRSKRRRTGRPSPTGIVDRQDQQRQPRQRQFDPTNRLTTDPP